ncbi:MAG: hypothetical protein AAF297_11820 [Planctomycetota bacterium]
MPEDQHPETSEDRARWIIAASVLAETFGDQPFDASEICDVQLNGCSAVLTEVESELGCVCYVKKVKADGATVIAKTQRPPAGVVELEWKSRSPVGGPHRFRVMVAEEIEAGSWAIRLSWVGVRSIVA